MYLNYDLSFNKFRRDGAIEYSKQHPEVKLFEVDTEDFASNEEAVDYLLTSKNQITAIFATMDTLAFSVFFICSKE